MGEKIRRQENFQPTFIQLPAQVDTNNKFGSTLSFDTDPLPAVGNCARVDSCNKLLMSSTEHKRKKHNFIFQEEKEFLKIIKEKLILTCAMFDVVVPGYIVVTFVVTETIININTKN